MKPKRQVEDMSGFCRHSGHHRLCTWGAGVETPSAVIVCVCPCHTPPVPSDVPRKVLVPKS